MESLWWTAAALLYIATGLGWAVMIYGLCEKVATGWLCGVLWPLTLPLFLPIIGAMTLREFVVYRRGDQ